MRDLHQLLDSVVDEQSFLEFAEVLRAERATFEGAAMTIDGFCGPWANNDIERFLEAAIAWSRDSDFGAIPEPSIQAPWRKFAAFLYAGRGYE